MKENRVKSDILKALGRRADVLVWNHPTGVGRSLYGNRVIRFGLVGSGDVVGVQAVEILPEHVGQVFGRALAIETKSSAGEQRTQQEKFEKAWTLRGGLYVLARGVEDIGDV